MTVLLRQTTDSSGYAPLYFSIETTSGGNIYIFVADGSLYIFKSTDGGASFTQLSSVHYDTIFNASGWQGCVGVTSAIDGSDVIHVLCTAQAYYYGSGRDCAHATLTTSTDTWSSWSAALSLSGEGAGQGEEITYPPPRIRLDANDVPHIFYRWSEDTGELRYTNKIGGSWLAPETVVAVGFQPNMLIVSTTVVNAMYETYDTYFHPSLKVRSSGGNWGSETDYTNESTALDADCMVATSDGTLYRYSWIGATGASYIYENDSLIYTGAEYEIGKIAACVVNDIKVIIIHDANADTIKYICKKGSMPWIPPETLVTNKANVMYLVSETGFFNKNENTKVNFAWCSWMGGTTYNGYYSSFVPDAAYRGSAHAYLSGDAHLLEPDSDITVGSWKNEANGAVLYTSLQDSSDSTYAWYDNCRVGDYFEVALQDTSGTPQGVHVLTWRAYRKAGVESITLKCELRQGSSTVIASDTQTINSASVVEFNKPLTAGEISSISNYNDLRIRITVMALAQPEGV